MTVAASRPDAHNGGMIRKLSRHGNSQALVIDKTMCEQLGINLETELQVEVSGGRLIIEPANAGLTPERRAEIVKELTTDYDVMLKKLAE